MTLLRTGEIAQIGEVDTYSVHMERGQPYDFYLSGHTDGMNGPFDPTLTIYDSYGNQVAYNDDGGPGLDAQIDDFSPAYSADYTLAVAGYGSGTGDYTLTGQHTEVNWFVAPDVV